MIQATTSVDGPPLSFQTSVRGLAIYLDNWAIGDLAEGEPARRKSFVDAVCDGGDLMFSVANAVELTGPQGKSFEAVKTFLNELGPNWFPVELDAFEVVQRERTGVDQAESCLSEGFLRAYFDNRTADYSAGSGKIIDLSGDFFSLGAVLDWLSPQRDFLRDLSAKFDGVLKTEILDKLPEYERNSSPAIPFHPSRRATFAWVNLVRTLFVEAKTHPVKKGDGLDLSHAVMASAFASVATLDTHWKRRVEGLPKPNGLARIYGPADLDQMVTDIESLLKQLKAQGSPARVPL